MSQKEIKERFIPKGTDPYICSNCDLAPACPLVYPQCVGDISDSNKSSDTIPSGTIH